MISYGQNFRCGFYEVPPKERIREIRKAGFDSVMFWWGDDFEDTDGNRYDLIEEAFAQGLKVHTIHFPSTHSDYIWRKEFCENYAGEMVNALEDCARYGVENMVVHTTRQLITPPYNEQGLAALSKAVRAAERLGVNIALENTRFPDYNRYIYDNLPSKRFTLCYDVGHENCYTPGRDILSEFGDRLTTTHIHDNDGITDQHHMIGEGVINFEKIFARLKSMNVRYYSLESYCNETSRYYHKLSLPQFLKQSFQTLVSCVEGCPVK